MQVDTTCIWQKSWCKCGLTATVTFMFSAACYLLAICLQCSD